MKLIDFIICDDVRVEMGNKFSLMGIYDSEIKIQTAQPEMIKFPILLSLALFMRLHQVSQAKNLVRYEIDASFNSVSIGNATNEITVIDKTKSFPLFLKFGNFPIPSPGELIFSIKLYFSDGSVQEIEGPKKIAISVEKISSNQRLN